MSDHCMHLTSVVNRFHQHNLRIKASKCSFGSENVVYLGHTISNEGIHTDLPSPSNLNSLFSFLSLSGYYHSLH